VAPRSGSRRVVAETTARSAVNPGAPI